MAASKPVMDAKPSMEITGSVGARVVLDPIAGKGLPALAQATATGGTIIVAGYLGADMFGYSDGQPTPFPFIDAVGRNLNVCSETKEEKREEDCCYRDREDLGTVKERIDDVRESRNEIVMDLAEQGFDLPADAELVPIYAHRYVICTSNLDCTLYCPSSFAALMRFVYGKSLEEYLEREFLR